MDLTYFTHQMAVQAQAISSLAAGINDEQARWKPDPDSWSILEVINHLYDEEREDFRTRLDIILHHPDKPWPPIDPRGWVTARQYNQRDLAESLANFLAERERSIAWLHSLPSPDWQATSTTPWGGQFPAGDMFASWVSHDLLHLRQLVELRWFYNARALQPYKGDYAGDW